MMVRELCAGGFLSYAAHFIQKMGVTMKYTIETSVFRLLTGLGVICLLGLAVPTDSFACHRDVTHGPRPVPCDDPPPDAEPPGTNETLAGWLGGLDAVENSLRNCGPGGGANLQAGHGEYGCDTNGSVNFTLTGGVQVGKKGSPQWCGKDFVVSTSANSIYNYVWNGDCTIPGGCSIEIWNWAYQTHNVNIGTGWPADVGLLIVRATAPHVAGTSDPNETNPYFDTLDLVATDVEVTFKAMGKNRTLAVCNYPRHTVGTEVFNDVIFHSEEK
jgi:hypothetical protein